MLRFALGTQGYNIIEADNGIDAIKLLAKETVDVLVVDWQMPVMNGIELVRILRDKPEFDELPIVMVSCWDNLTARREAYSLGVNTWLKKPFRMSEIQSVVETALLAVPPGVSDGSTVSRCI
jgi:response regulator RpfG family c-di-GMP phosphodiesterase